MRKEILFIGVIVSGHVALLGQSAAMPTFEVASIRASHDMQTEAHHLSCATSGRFLATGQFPQSIVQWAYSVQPFQLLGEKPSWFTDPRDIYDIEAKAAGPVSEAQCKRMVQALFEDQFKLKFHHETREVPVFALVVGKNKPKLREVKDGDPPGGVVFNGNPVRSEDGELARGWRMQDLAREISGVPSLDGRPVVDRTGLNGLYAFKLDFALFTDPDRPDIRTAVDQQLGLRLESSKDSFEMLYIDHVERPTGN